MVLLLMGSGCSLSTKAPAAPRPSTGVEDPWGQRTEPASGEVREALLALQRVHFGYNKWNVLPDARTALEAAAKGLREHPDVQIYIDGHADQRGTPEHNLWLGEQRAQAVAHYLAQLGISADRLHTTSFGKREPAAVGSDAAAYAANRRVEFRLVQGDVQLVVEKGVLYDDFERPLSLR
ncbi:MAG TPA: OmpA family protein [Polyangiaceae bacterium]|nr:OmpA family protein [Polyangiaceae bacterium]